MKNQLDKNLNHNTVVPLLKDDEFSSEFMGMIKGLKEAKGSKRINNGSL